MATAAPSTAAARASAAAVPAHTLTFLRRLVAHERYPDGRAFVRALFAKASRTYAQGGRLTAAEAARLRAAAVLLWHEAQPSPLGGRVFA